MINHQLYLSKSLSAMRSKKLILFILFIGVFAFGAVPSWAQTGQITGTVMDSTSGEPLPGVNVVVVGTQQGASTNAEGTYTIPNLDPGTYDLRATFIGYRERIVRDVSVSAGETTQVNFALMPGEIQLEEVVAVGYGVQREEDVTSAVASVDEQDFLAGSPRDVAALIDGQIAGLNIQQTTGDPRANSEISLRGTTTLLSSSDPLILIDGVPGDLNTVAPQQIKSIDVLKGGSAAAIYGTRASNGVILITTTEQAESTTSRIQYSSNVSYGRINNRPNFMTADEFRSLTDLTDYGHNTDWLEEITNNTLSHTHNLVVSGGSGNTSYNGSLNYENRQGLFMRSDNERTVGRINITHSMYDRALSVDANVTARLRNYYNGTGFNFEYTQAMIRNPTDRVYNDEGMPQERGGYFYENPVGLIEESNGRQQTRELRLNGTVTWRPLNGLALELLGAANRELGMSDYAETFRHRSTRIRGLDGYASRSAYQSKDQLIEFTGTYDREIGSHDFSILGGYSYQYVQDEGFNAANQDFPTDLFGSSNLESGQGINEGKASISSYESDWKLASFFGRVNYNWNSKYILMGSVRYEGSSKFGRAERWGAFPALSAGWRIGQESFMDGVSFVDQLKLRAGFGVTGIAPSARYLHLTSYEYGGSFYNNGEWVQGLSPARNPNPNLKWEEKREVDIGVDFTLFNQKVSGSVGVYRRTTDDMLWDYDVPVPPNLFGTTTANVGEMRNEGVEADVEYNVLSRGDVDWTITANYSSNRNELVSLSNQLYQTERDWFTAGYTGEPIQLPTHRVEIGRQIGNFYGFKSVDITDEGEWIVLDSEGNETHIDNVSTEARRTLGNGVPNHRLALNTTFQYGNFDLRLNMRGAFAFEILNFQRMFFENPTMRDPNKLVSAFDKVYGKAVLDYPLAYTSYYVEDGDYWKLENITLGYRFNSIGNVISNARVYISGRNLFTLTGYNGIDPEVSATGLDPGNDPRYKYPTTRRYTVGVNITFSR